MATSLSGAILGWDEHLEFIQDASYDATSLSEQRERETSGSNERFIGKTTTTEKGKDSHKAASSVNVLSTGWWEAARARHKGECVGGACWMRVQTVCVRSGL